MSIIDQQIQNMMEYISSRPHGCYIHKREEGVYHVYGYMATQKIPRASDKAVCNMDARDERVFYVDFNNKTIEYCAYDVSGHNGDHYNCVELDVDWSHLLTCYDALKQVVQQLAAKQVAEEELAKAGEKRLNEILSGEYRVR